LCVLLLVAGRTAALALRRSRSTFLLPQVHITR
jgi:hypothetical protein